MSLNKVFLMGRLGKDPESKTLQDGTAICSFSVATSESFKDKSGQKQEKTEWHFCKTFGRLAEICNQYLKKGRQVLVEGKIQTRSWDDKDGVKKYATEILASNVTFIGGEKEQGQAAPKDDFSYAPKAAKAKESQQDLKYTADDIPF